MVKAISNNNDIFLVDFIPPLDRQIINFRQANLHKIFSKWRLITIKWVKLISEPKVIRKVYQWSEIKIPNISRVKDRI